jgi:hypothetical protein
MKPWQFALVATACLVAAGCRTDPNIVLLERELRLQEDEIYRLQAVVEDYQAALRACEQHAGMSALCEPAESDLDGLPRLPVLENVPSAAESVRPAPTDDYGDPRSVAPPSPYGDPSLTPPESDWPDDPTEHDPPDGPADPELLLPGSPNGPGDDGDIHATTAPGPMLPADSRDVVSLTLDRFLTAGQDLDGRPGDDGLLVVIQPRDARGRAIEAPAEVSIVVLDPAFTGDAARLARWDFTPAETAARFGRLGAEAAICLDTVWPADPPLHDGLYLFVRYTTADGRKLEAEGPIQIALPGQAPNRWEPAAPAPSPLRAGRPTEPRLGSLPEAHPAPIAATPSAPTIRRPVWSPNRQ